MSINLSTSSASDIDSELRIQAQPEFPKVGLAEQTNFHANVTLTAPTLPEDDDPSASRAPVNLVCVIDRSGSMQSQNKLKLVKETLTFAVNQMKDCDNLGLVTFDDSVRVNLPLTKMTKSGRKAALDAIKPINTGGCTNLSGGLLAGLELLRNKYGVTATTSKKSKAGWWPFGRKSSSGDEKEKESETVSASSSSTKPAVDAVLLLTDGLANGGITDTAGIVRAATNMLETLPSVCSIHTFGYGSDHDVGMLEAIAEAGHGGYNFVESADKVSEAFGDAIGGLMSVACQQIKLTVAVPRDMGIELGSVETTYSKTNKGNNVWEISLGDLYAEEERDVLVVLKKVPGVEVETSEYPVLAAQVEYVDVIAGVPRTADASCFVDRVTEVPSNQVRAEKIEIQVQRIATASTLREAARAAEKGDREGARRMMRSRLTAMKASTSARSAKTLSMVTDLEAMDDAFADNFEAAKQSKMMFAMSNSHAQQRSYAGASLVDGGGAYVTKKKRAMKAKFAST